MSQKTPYHCFFNGDADGIAAVVQFIHSGFIIDNFFTGHKRDQTLLRHGETLWNAKILACDIELAKNMDSVKKMLDNKCEMCWFDHHGNGEEKLLLEYPNFTSNIDIAANTNTALIVYKLLNKPELLKWAIVGLFGDNIDGAALHYCQCLNLSQEEISILTNIGKLINYNSYGESFNDLIIDPIAILHKAKEFKDPITFFQQTDIGERLAQCAREDLKLGLSYCEENSQENYIILLPNLPWARRVYGTLGNYLVKQYKTKPVAILVDIGADHYLVSVRAPLDQPTGAGDLCRLFPSGGGRAGAGGINKLYKNSLEQFLESFQTHWMGMR
ncbi:hypothetical protein [Candidatus Tisiphia endosymbiont of Nemotelus uliginosus]|uniref:hypothetical protein n=1 Tax=Candidatus Tisiphia endosymbiont of Nemotelus uliginosus TaxID=3077926 RepID=UPI0035C8956B